MTRAEWLPDEELVVGATGELSRDAVDELEAAVAAAGGSLVYGDVRHVIDSEPMVVVAVGRSALSAVTRARSQSGTGNRDGLVDEDGARAEVGVETGNGTETETETPILPIATGPGIATPPVDELADTISDVLGGAGTDTTLPVLSVTIDGHPCGSALFEITLVTDEPARISEYSLRAHGEHLAQFRADGVTVATPVGSHGYASTAGGPLLSTAVDAVVAVPIAPFVTHGRQWILPDDNLEVTVERNETDVVCQLDDELVGPVDLATPVRISATEAEPLTVVLPPTE